MSFIFNNPVFLMRSEIFIFSHFIDTSTISLEFAIWQYICFILNMWYKCPKLTLLLQFVFLCSLSGFKGLVSMGILVFLLL